jgi:hypothetical protein
MTNVNLQTKLDFTLFFSTFLRFRTSSNFHHLFRRTKLCDDAIPLSYQCNASLKIMVSQDIIGVLGVLHVSRTLHFQLSRIQEFENAVSKEKRIQKS